MGKGAVGVAYRCSRDTFLSEHKPDDYVDPLPLQDEVVRTTKKTESI